MIKNLTTSVIEEKNGKLVFDNVLYSDLVMKYQTPLFVILPNVIKENINLLKDVLKSIFRNYEIFYSLKTNYHEAVVKTVRHENIGVELVSPFEMNIALNYWPDLSNSMYGGLFKTSEHLQFAISHEIKFISVESLNEIPWINKIAEGMNRVQKILFRVRSVTNQYLGIDIKKNIDPIKNTLEKYDNIDLCGLHIHTPTKKTFYREFMSRTSEILGILSILESKTDIKITTLNLGGGLPESSTIQKSDLVSLFTDIKEIIDTKGYSTNKLKILLEPGRFIVGNACVFISKVLDIRYANGKKWIVLDVGTHQIPKFGKGELRFFVANDVISSYNTVCSIVGPLPTESDILRKNYNLPDNISIGTPIAVLNAGAYTFSLWREFCTSRPKIISIENGLITVY